jgi:alkanesulfonate monooxygenase SsuD/methylene tetrahydromethanopterin reductase-like flavin-dependent oxidoreductase (luciferase family)
MRIGVKPGQIGLTVPQLRRCWREAEDAGFESLWTFDHLTLANGQAVYEACALLAAMAEATSRVRIGCLVLAGGSRRVETLAATLATIDALSDGRLEVGLGAASGFAKLDFDALGIPYPALTERLAMFAGTVDRLLELTGADSPLGARPVQSPLPLILGGSARAIREMAIARGLSWNLSADSVEDFRRLAAGQGDPQAQVFVRDISSVGETVSAYREAGATRLVLVLVPPIEPGDIGRLARLAGI